MFSGTHFIFNIDQPKGKGNFINVMDLEEVLRARTIQLWFAFRDDAKYDRYSSDSSATKAFDVVSKLQARLAAGLKKGKENKKTYDEILLSNNLNVNADQPSVGDLKIGVHRILVFSRRCLDSISIFLELAPGTRQDSLVGGLTGDFRSMTQIGNPEDFQVLAVRRANVGHRHGLNDRARRARQNRDRLALVRTASRMLTTYPEAIEDGSSSSSSTFSTSLVRRLEDIEPRSMTGSRMSTLSRSTSKLDSRRSSKLESVKAIEAGTYIWTQGLIDSMPDNMKGRLGVPMAGDIVTHVQRQNLGEAFDTFVEDGGLVYQGQFSRRSSKASRGRQKTSSKESRSSSKTRQIPNALEDDGETYGNLGPAFPALIDEIFFSSQKKSKSPGGEGGNDDSETDSEAEGLSTELGWAQYQRQWQMMHGRRPECASHSHEDGH
jgi:hypothetical protein